jgi:hypothetical protein
MSPPPTAAPTPPSPRVHLIILATLSLLLAQTPRPAAPTPARAPTTRLYHSPVPATPPRANPSFLLPAMKPKRRSGDQPQHPEAAESQNDASSSVAGSKKIKKSKAQGKVHGGLGVKLVNLDAGNKDMLLSRVGE